MSNRRVKKHPVMTTTIERVYDDSSSDSEESPFKRPVKSCSISTIEIPRRLLRSSFSSSSQESDSVTVKSTPKSIVKTRKLSVSKTSTKKKSASAKTTDVASKSAFSDSTDSPDLTDSDKEQAVTEKITRSKSKENKTKSSLEKDTSLESPKTSKRKRLSQRNILADTSNAFDDIITSSTPKATSNSAKNYGNKFFKTPKSKKVETSVKSVDTHEILTTPKVRPLARKAVTDHAQKRRVKKPLMSLKDSSRKRKSEDPWLKAMKKNPHLADFIDEFNKTLDKSENLGLSIVEEKSSQVDRTVNDWLLNRTV
ncbi:hypothetical protein HDE_02493 [Halotydeus destructor]|nr:hypothetical protein HDE_02493 [Halotydeus destructor]